MEPDAPAVLHQGLAPVLNPHAWLGAVGALGLAALLGYAFLPRLRAWRWGDALLLRLTAGLPLAALAVLGVGQVSGLVLRFPWLGLAGVGWGLVLADGILRLRRRPRERETLATSGRPRRSGLGKARFWTILVGWEVLILVLLYLLAPALCPPINYDVMEYHLGIVPHIFEVGRVQPIPHVFYSAQPIATELLYTLSALIEGTPQGHAPGLLHWFLILLATLLIVRSLRLARVPALWRPWLLLILLVHPGIVVLEVDRMTDWMGLLMLAGGTWIYLRGRYPCRQQPDRQQLGGTPEKVVTRPLRMAALMGIYAGGGLSAKWTHAGTVFLPLLLLAFSLGAGMLGRDQSLPEMATPRRRLGRGLWAAAACLGVGGLLWLPWGVWLWVVRGNPFAPFAARLFPTAAWPPSRQQFLLATHGPLGFAQAEYWTNLAARLGWRLSGLPLIALALVGVVALALMMAARPRKALPALAVSGAPRSLAAARSDSALIFWLSGGMLVSVLLWGQLRDAASRFLAPAMMTAILVLPLLLALGIRRFGRALTIHARAGVRLAVAFLLVLAALAGLFHPEVPFMNKSLNGIYLSYATGQTDETGFWRPILEMTTDLFAAANKLPPGSRILAINEARRYPFTRPITLASVFDESPLRPALTGAPDGQTIRRRLVGAGYTHLLVNEFEQNRILFMHTPQELLEDRGLRLLLDKDSPRASRLLAEHYWGYTEFSGHPLSPPERQAYGQFLSLMRARALWDNHWPSQTAPAMWIAPLK